MTQTESSGTNRNEVRSESMPRVHGAKEHLFSIADRTSVGFRVAALAEADAECTGVARFGQCTGVARFGRRVFKSVLRNGRRTGSNTKRTNDDTRSQELSEA